MSQPSEGSSRPQRRLSEPFALSTAPTSGVLPHTRIAELVPVDSRLLELSLKLCQSQSDEEALELALVELRGLLPDCGISLLPDSTVPDPLRGREAYVWQLGELRGSSALSLRLAPETPEAEGVAVQIGDRVATMLSAFLRHAATQRELEAQRQRFADLFDRAVQAEKLASYGRVVAGVLHDLNNPLTAILAYSDYLGRALPEQGVSPADLQRLMRIREAAERAHCHTRSLVEYARPSGNQIAPVDLAKVVQNAMMFCEHEFAIVGIRTEVDFAQLRQPVLGIPGQLTQLFVNLFTNAAHAARENDALLSVECDFDQERRGALIRVSDNGTGILDADLDRIFDPFFTTKSNGRGNGLGLSIVRDIVEGHSGRIRVSSQLGCGTTFTLWLPLAEGERC